VPGAGTDGFGSSTNGVPAEAPALLWTAVIAAVALWWLWPWLARLRGDANQELLGARQAETGGLRLPHAPQVAADILAQEQAAEEAAQEPAINAIAEAGAGRLTGELDFNLATEFSETFTSAAKFIAAAIDGPPTGDAYTTALTALKKFGEILDRLFNAFGSPEELTKVTCLKEAGDTFRRDYGEHKLGATMRGLLQLAGFERRDSGDPVWVFPHEDSLSRLRGLTVRLCMIKLSDRQKKRGPGRFLHTNNDTVIPQLEDASFVELVDLYKGKPRKTGHDAPAPPSMRERSLQADVRIKLNERREEKGMDPLALHEGLAAIARTLAENQRTRARKDEDDLYPTRQIAGEVRAALSRVPLPPGFAAAHLHWSSTELPRLFGLTSTRGAGEAGKKDTEDDVTAAQIMATEAISFWDVRQNKDVYWPAGAICGIGAALDYTVNKGFVVALLVGYERQQEEDMGLSSASNELRRRPVAKEDEKKRPPVEPPKFTPMGSHKPKIKGFRDL